MMRYLRALLILFSVFNLLASCNSNPEYFNNSYQSKTDSVNITKIVTKPINERFNYKARFRDKIFYLFVQGLGHCYAIDSEDNVLWEINLSETSGDVSGVFQINNVTDFFGLLGGNLFFFQGSNDILMYDFEGNLKDKHSLVLPKEEKVIEVLELSDSKLAIGTINQKATDQVVGFIYIYDLNKHSLRKIFSKTLDFPLGFKIGSNAGELFYTEDLGNLISILDQNGKIINQIEIIKTSEKDYNYHPPYVGDPKDFFKMSQEERAKFQNDGHKGIYVVDKDIILHHKISGISKRNKNVKELITIQNKNQEFSEIKLQYSVLNLDHNGNVFSLIKHQGNVYLKVNPLFKN
jgi:hypothetical protein